MYIIFFWETKIFDINMNVIDTYKIPTKRMFLLLNSAFEGSKSFSKGSESFFLSSITQNILANLEGSHHCQLSPEILSDT